MTSFSCLYCQLRTYFTPCSSVSIVNFEHVIAGWVCIMFNLSNTLNVYILNPSALERSFKVAANLLGELSTNIETESVLLTELSWLPGDDIHVKIRGT